MSKNEIASLTLYNSKEFKKLKIGKESISINADTKPYLSLADNTFKSRATLSLDCKGSPSLELSDSTGKDRAVIGHASLETVKTGSTTETNESSVILYDKKGKVIWSEDNCTEPKE